MFILEKGINQLLGLLLVIRKKVYALGIAHQG